MQLAWLGAMEGRWGSHDLARRHYCAAWTLLNALGGFGGIHSTKVDHTRSISILWCFLHRHCGFFETEDAILAALGRFVLPKGCRLDARLRRYFEGEHCCREHLANLHMLSTIAEDEPKGYTDDLRNLLPKQGEFFSPSGISFAIPTCAYRVGAWHGENPVIRSGTTVEFVELLGYASLKHREAVKDALFASLFDGYHCYVNLSEIKADILGKWRAERYRHKALKENDGGPSKWKVDDLARCLPIRSACEADCRSL